jgi:hypothetical protein
LGGLLEDHVTDIVPLTNGAAVLVGFSNSNDGDCTGNHKGFDIWLCDVSSTTSVREHTLNLLSEESLVAYPNPCREHTTIQIARPLNRSLQGNVVLYSPDGKEVWQHSFSSDENLNLQCQGLPRGPYECVFYESQRAAAHQWIYVE